MNTGYMANTVLTESVVTPYACSSQMLMGRLLSSAYCGAALM